jgi:hypothetical protein
MRRRKREDKAKAVDGHPSPSNRRRAAYGGVLCLKRMPMSLKYRKIRNTCTDTPCQVRLACATHQGKEFIFHA